MRTKSVYCIATTRGQADQIADNIRAAHFARNDISVLFSDKDVTRTFADEMNTKLPESSDTGAGVGTGIGGLVGGALGWIAGIGLMTLPGLGPFIAAGPLLIALDGAIIGAALNGAAVGSAEGGIARGLISLGVSEGDANGYEGKVKGGQVLIAVQTQDSAGLQRVKQIFTAAGADDISTASQ